MAFKNSVLRRILELKRSQLAGGWSKLDNEEHHNYLYWRKWAGNVLAFPASSMENGGN
jgi:hypothetical protein